MPDTERTYGTVVTSAGLALVTAATMRGEKVKLKYLAVGDGGGQAPEGNGDLPHPVAAQQVQNVTQHRLAQKGGHGLGTPDGQGPQPASFSPRQNNCLQGNTTFFMMSLSMASKKRKNTHPCSGRATVVKWKKTGGNFYG